MYIGKAGVIILSGSEIELIEQSNAAIRVVDTQTEKFLGITPEAGDEVGLSIVGYNAVLLDPQGNRKKTQVYELADIWITTEQTYKKQDAYDVQGWQTKGNTDGPIHSYWYQQLGNNPAKDNPSFVSFFAHGKNPERKQSTDLIVIREATFADLQAANKLPAKKPGQ